MRARCAAGNVRSYFTNMVRRTGWNWWIISAISIASSQPFIRSFAFGEASKSYWLNQGGTRIEACTGNNQGKPLKVANKDGAWILLTGEVICKDTGDSYSYEVTHLSVEINPSARSRIERNQLSFDWLGLAIFRPQGSGETINWLYDDSLPIRGTLKKMDTNRIYFGNLNFKVPKTAIEKATNCLFYVLSEGILYHFEFI
jgi:hypothetical protein